MDEFLLLLLHLFNLITVLRNHVPMSILLLKLAKVSSICDLPFKTDEIGILR